MNDTTVTPEELPVSEQPDPVKELEAVRTGTVTILASDYAQNMKMAEEIGKFKMSRALMQFLLSLLIGIFKRSFK